MSDRNASPTAGRPSEDCLRCEAALADLLDGTLTPEQEAELTGHAGGCESCGELLESARDGRAWAKLLHDTPPAVPDTLLGKILAQTSQHPLRGTPESPLAPGAPVLPHAVPAGSVWAPVWALPGHRETRWLMTAAMAFFSIAATLSITGIHASDLHPAAVQAAASRQFFDVKKQVVSFYDNLALVRELQSTIDQMHQSRNQKPAGGESLLNPSRTFTQAASFQTSLLEFPSQAEERISQ
jgi:hypothetical protein